MNDSARCVLSISYDQSLLHTREWILKAAGFHVVSALGFTDAAAHCGNARFDLVIIGHSIPYKDKVALVSQIKTHNQPQILALRGFGEESVEGVKEYLHSSLLGPDDLLAAVRSVLGGKEAPESGGTLSR